LWLAARAWLNPGINKIQLSFFVLVQDGTFEE